MASHRVARCWVALVLVLSGCAGEEASEPPAPESRWVLQPDSANVAILQFNRQTYALEGGALRRFTLCQDCDLDSLPFAYSLERPSDFGWYLFRYLGTRDTVLYATSVWMGRGKILVPPALLPPDSFAVASGVMRAPLSVRYYDCPATDPQTDTLWAAAQKVDITREFSTVPYRLGIFLYSPEGGMYYSQKWVVFLYAGNRPAIWPRRDGR